MSVDKTKNHDPSTHLAIWRPLAKLHGSTHDGNIVPPTWSKGVVTSVVPAWELAHNLLSEATQIRIIGYSLPTADSYLKYLLKSAVIKEQNLKRIDVICRDPDGSVRKRYDEFIKFDYYKFVAGDVSKYLEIHNLQMNGNVGRNEVLFNKIETAHTLFMG